MNTAVNIPPSPNPTVDVRIGSRTALAGAAIAFIIFVLGYDDLKKGTLFAIGLGLGMSLFYSSFGFAAAYRKAIVHKQMTGVIAQIIMIGFATVLFAPVLAEGKAVGAWAPVGVQVGVGAFIFGIGMQLGGACASGTLFTIGGGNGRMFIALVFFCLGAFIGSLHLGWWGQLPSWGTHSLGQTFGWGQGVVIQLVLFSLMIYVLMRIGRKTQQVPLWFGFSNLKEFITGPWPLLLSALSLAFLNFLTLLNAGHPWSVTWAFTLWGAKLATLFGWDSTTSAFWSAPFQSNALSGSIFEDTTSLMNIGVIVGAFIAAFIANKFSFKIKMSFKNFLAIAIGGVLMGYGARLAYGCNIGALFSGMASTSLHAWLWIVCAMMGTYLGIKIRPFFDLEK